MSLKLLTFYMLSKIIITECSQQPVQNEQITLKRMNLQQSPPFVSTPFITSQKSNESLPTPQNMVNSTASRRSNPRTLYFKKEYKLFIHSIHVFNNLSFLSLTNDIGRAAKHQCESVFVLEKFIDIVTMNAIKGTQDYIDEKVTLHFKQQNIASNSIIGSVKFDMAQQKMVKLQNPKLFKKQFENNNGFIQYKFISYQSHHIKNDQVAAQKQVKRHVLQLMNDTKDFQFQSLIKAKDDIIKQLSQKITELIDEGKKYRKSVSKQKQSLNKQLQKLKVQNIKIKKTPPKRNPSPKSDLFKFFSPQNRFNLLHQQDHQQEENRILNQRQNAFNINVKVLSNKARQKQFQALEEMTIENNQLKKAVEELKEQVGSLNVENKMLLEKISEMKTSEKALESKHQMDIFALKQSTKLALQKNKLMQLSGYYAQLPPATQKFLSVNPKQSIQPKVTPNHQLPIPSPPRQNQKPKFSTNQYIADKKIDPQTVIILHKIQEQNEMLISKLDLKEEQCARVLKQLQNCTIQLKKKNSEIQHWKIKYDELKSRHSPFMFDDSESKDTSVLMNKESLRLSGIHLQKRSQQLQLHSNSKPAVIEKVLMEMKGSIICYEGKIQDNEIQLMRSRIAQETLQKQKALYENKYMNILQTLETSKEKYAQALTKQAQLESVKNQNQQLKNFMEEMMKKYEDELKMRTDYQEKAERYKSKAKEMLEQWERLKLMQTQYDSLKRKNADAEKTLIKFETNYSEMKKFVLKIQDSYFNVTKKRKSTSKQQINEQQLEEQLEQCITRLNQLEDQYYDGMRGFYDFQKKQIDFQVEKRFQLQCDRIDQRNQLREQQKLLKKQAIEETLENDRKNKRKKIDAKIKALLNEKAKAQQLNQKQQGLTILDRLKTLQKRLRQFDQKLIEAPNYKIRVNGGQNQEETNIKVSSPVLQKLTKQTKQKIQRLEQQNQRLRSMMGNHPGKDSITSGDRRSLGTGKGSDHQNLLLKNSQNATLQMQRSVLYAQNANTQSMIMIKQQRKTMIQEMSKGRQMLNKTFEDIKKQNSELMKKKTEYEIELQNMRFKEQKLVMKSQQRERELQRMHKTTSDELMNTRDRLEAKIQKIERENAIFSKQNKDLQQSLASLILQMRRVADLLQQRDKECHELEDDVSLMRERIFNYEEAERQMITEIEQMRQIVSGCQDRFQKLFEDRDAEFLNIQKLKQAEIFKLKKFIKELEESVDEELSEQLRLKQEIDRYEKEVKRLEETNITLEESEKVLSQKLQNLRNHSLYQMLRLEEENQSLRTQLIKIAEQTTVLQEELQKKRHNIQSLQRQVETLEPIYNQICQLQLKHQAQRQKYQELMGAQNLKFVQLRQKYEKIVETIKSVEEENKQLRQRDIQFENMRTNANDRLFDRERLVLKIQKEKHSLQVEVKRLKQQVDDTKDKQDHYVLQNHQLAIKNQELQQQLNQLKEKSFKPKSKVHIHQGNSIIDEPINQSKVFGLNSRINIGENTNRNNIDRKSKLRLSRSNSRVLSRSGNKVQESKQLITSSKQIGTSKSILKSKSLVQIQENPAIKRSNNISIATNGQQRSSRDHSEPVSPYTRILKQDLHQIEENIDEMKATVFIKKSSTQEIIPSDKMLEMDNEQNLKNSVIMELQNLVQSTQGKNKMPKSKTLQEDLNIEEVSDSSLRQQKPNNLEDQDDDYNFSPQEESEFEILIQLEKKDIIERVHELKQELATLTDENQGLKQQLQNYLRLISSNMSGQSPYQMDHIFPQINILEENNGDPNRQRNKFFGDKDDFNVFKDGYNLKGQSVSFISQNTHSDRNLIFSDRNRNSRNNEMSRTQQNNFKNQNPRISRNNTAEKQMYQQEINRLQGIITQKELIIEEHLQQINQLTDQLEHEKQNTSKLMEEVESLMKGIESIEGSLQEKNQSIDHLSHLLVEEKKKFQLKLQKILSQSLDKDHIVTEIAQRCDKLQRSKEQLLKEKLKLEDKYQKYSKQYQKLKQRQKSTQKSYKLYEEQSQLQILKLNEQKDILMKQIKTRNKQMQQLAERYVDLQNKMREMENSIVEQSNKTLSKDQKVKMLMEKYKKISLRLQQSQQQRRKGAKQRQKLQSEIVYNQSLIQQLKRNASMMDKKHHIQNQSTKQSLQQMRSKNQQLQQHILQLKQQLSYLNEQIANMTQMHKSQQRDYGRVEKQLKEIMQSYQSEFSKVNCGKLGLAEELRKVSGLLKDRQVELQKVRRETHSSQGELHKLRNQLYQVRKEFQTYKHKAVQEIKELREKYQFKNNDYEILKLKLNLISQNHQIDTSSSTLGKTYKNGSNLHTNNQRVQNNNSSNRERKLQERVNKLQRQLKEKNKRIEQIEKKMRQKQVEAGNQLQSATNKQLLFTARIHQLQQQLSSAQQQLHNTRRTLTINQHSQHINQNSTINSLNSQLQHYQNRVQQLERENFYLKKHNEQCGRNVEEIKKSYVKKENKLNQQIEELEQEVHFYKAKRIDQLNILLNQTYQD